MTMRVFSSHEVADAIAHAASGGVALHLHAIIPDRARAPRCFVAAVDRGEPICHMFCLDRECLIRTARSFGVRVIHIGRDGTARQHIDLCAGPLRKAYKLLPTDELLRLHEILTTFGGNVRV